MRKAKPRMAGSWCMELAGRVRDVGPVGESGCSTPRAMGAEPQRTAAKQIQSAWLRTYAALFLLVQ